MAVYEMKNKINEMKEDRSITIDSIIALEKSIEEMTNLDDFNNSYLFSEGGDPPAIQDLIKLYYEEINIENGTTFTHPTLDNYTKVFWEELLDGALVQNGDGIFYPFTPGADVSNSLENAGISSNEMVDMLNDIDNKVDKVPSALENELAIFGANGGIKSSGSTIEQIISEGMGLDDATEIEAETGLTNGIEGEEPVVRLWSPEKINTAIRNLAHYEHNQAVQSDVWTIKHKLGKYPSVTIINSDNQEVIGKVIYNSISEIEVSFSIEISGTAYLN